MTRYQRTFNLPTEAQGDAVILALIERSRQDGKWGDQIGVPRERMLLALMEEVGEACEAQLGNGKPGDFCSEMIQVSALALMLVEHELRKMDEAAKRERPDTGSERAAN